MQSKKTEQIAKAQRQALQHKRLAIDLASKGSANAETHAMYSRMEERNAADLLAVVEPPQLGSGEVVPAMGDEDRVFASDTLATPNALNLEASGKRIDLTSGAGVFEMAIDAAESIGAKNSLEKMLAHQLALCHEATFKLMTQGMNTKDTIEKARLANSAARMMGVFQDGLLTLQRIRTGGRQVVTVQHVSVSEGGQAVVAAHIGTGGRRGRGATKNEG